MKLNSDSNHSFSQGRETQQGMSGFCEQAEFSSVSPWVHSYFSGTQKPARPVFYWEFDMAWFSTKGQLVKIPRKICENSYAEPCLWLLNLEQVWKVEEDAFDRELCDEMQNINHSDFGGPYDLRNSVCGHIGLDLLLVNSKLLLLLGNFSVLGAGVNRFILERGKLTAFLSSKFKSS